jgi:chemosensory pili system protein ChpA (sensor histidine kinase/response regulator)
MTLTVTGSVLVQIAGTTYAVPLDAVEQILRLDADQAKHAFEERELRLNGTTYPLVHLAKALQLAPFEENASGPLPVLLMHLGSGKAAAIVDKVLGGREIVVKPLGTHLKRVRGILGATMLGDGQVVPIINPTDLGEAPGTGGSARQTEDPATPPSQAAGAAARVLSVMIVDDSPSVRRINSTLVKNAGWIPVTAKDGLDALEQLRHSAKPPDVILLDIEMPRMDGYELLATLRGQEAYRYVPVIMITSRMSEKHRKKAMDLGVSEYLTKPYNDDDLLGHIRRLAL